MADPACCNKGPNELLAAILGLDQEIFDRLQQVIEAVIAGAGSDIESGSQAIANGAGTVSVVFPVAFAGVPNVVVTISRPANGDLLQVNLDENSITAAGFTAAFSDVTPNGNYLLKWIATV